MCKTRRIEYLEIFYRRNIFGFLAPAEGLTSVFKNNPHFALVQHADLCPPFFPKSDGMENKTFIDTYTTNSRETIDVSVSTCTNDLLRGCPSLKTLKVRLPDVDAIEVLLNAILMARRMRDTVLDGL